MLTRQLCDHGGKEMSLSWVNAKTGYQTTGPVCRECAASVWAQLSKFPDAIATATIERTTC